MKKLFLLCVIVFTGSNSFAQHEFDKWIFGNGLGLDFSGGVPSVIQSNINGFDNSASISDSSGNLLFFTEGMHIYDRNGNLMPNGNNIMGDTSGGQGATIVRMPEHNNRYYVFTLPAFASSNGLRYTVVDMDLNSGLGDIDTAFKNILLFTPATEKVVPVIHNNGNDIWIVAHEWNNNTFRSYLLTSNGVMNSFISSSVGSSHGTSQNNAIGQFTVNKTGTRIACGIEQDGKVEIFDYNSQSGTISNPITITGCTTVIGLEFSPDGSKLYTTHLNDSTLTQFDLSNYNQSAILASKVIVGGIPNTFANYYGGYMQTGPDGKIYVVPTFSNKIGVINNPNVIGSGCNYNGAAINLGNKTVDAGLVDKIAVTSNHINSIQTISSQEVASASVYPNPFNSNTIVRVNGIMGKYDFALFDVNGNLLKKMISLNDSQFELQRESYPSGVYIYKISSSSDHPVTGQIIIY